MVMSTKEDVLYPLSFMRMNRGLPKLSYEEMDPSLLPEPYQSLLVHEGDMTSRLEGFHESAIKVRRLRSSNDGKITFARLFWKRWKAPSPRIRRVRLFSKPFRKRRGNLWCKLACLLVGFSMIADTYSSAPSGLSESCSGRTDRGSFWFRGGR